MKDLATAFVKVLGNDKASRQIYNISGERFVTFDGIGKACALAAGAPEPELVHYNPKEFDFGGVKAFPLRDQHFFTSIAKVGFVSCGDCTIQSFLNRSDSNGCSLDNTVVDEQSVEPISIIHEPFNPFNYSIMTMVSCSHT